ncbi:MAG: hypothetical protein V7L22_33145 [Nostoc sp.]|uniref:hypothetical protein n=1 Tax=Nostoc sp. TaxID=1180 RepID=UPI002FFA6453
MKVTEILKTLPAPLEWMVLFDLSRLYPITDIPTIRAMFHLPTNLDLSDYSHVVLANSGRFLAYEERSRLVEVSSGRGWSQERIRYSLYDRFQEQLSLFAVDEANCLGLGETAPYPPVVLHIKIEDGVGRAQAAFAQPPSQQHYELLQAIGVKFLGGKMQRNFYLAQFHNRLPTHIHAAILSHFSRTAHCNLFFLRHGNIDADLKSGLLKAATARINWAKNCGLRTLAQRALQVNQQSMAMVCQPPLPEQPFFYGDLVPLGFVALALRESLRQSTVSSAPDRLLEAEITAAYQTLETFLLSQKHQDLWAFHRDRLITATDSALVLMGLQVSQQIASLKALERFADGNGGYYPQQWATTPQPDRMLINAQCQHWCQPDFATTCAIAALQQEVGLLSRTSIEYIADRISVRCGLYFANPYLVDWVTIRALGNHLDTLPLRQHILSEIQSSINPDYTFGQYDIAFSTALAILCLAELGIRDKTLRLAQLGLIAYMDAEGQFPVAAPFYSSLRLDQDMSAQALSLRLIQESLAVKSTSNAQKQIHIWRNQYHAVSLYWDVHLLMSTAIATLALSVTCDEKDFDQQSPNLLSEHNSNSTTWVHPRYQCRNHFEYIVNFALPPYIVRPNEV